MKTVSVIIPVYNAMPFLKDTMASVFNQCYPEIEIIAIDDGSTDDSFAYLQGLDVPHFILRKNRGKGACAARNYGFELSKGDYIQYLDGDDILSADKIQLQVEALKNSQRHIAVCHTKHFYTHIDNGKITDHDFLYTTNDPSSFLLKLYGADGQSHNMVQTSAWLTPRNLVEQAGPWDETLSKDQDGEFFCRVVTNAEQVVYTPHALNYYRKHVKGANIANQKQQHHIESQLKALQSKSQQFSNLKTTAAYKNAMALQYKIIAIEAFPQFKTLSKQALKQSNEFGGSRYLPVLGGKIIESIKHSFGWRAAKSFSVFIHKYFLNR